MNICTIIAKNYLAHARVLAESFQRHHSDGRCFVLVIDETDGYLDPAHEPFTLVRPEQIGLDAWDEMRGAYDVMELSTAVKPWLLRHMLREHDDGSGVAYLDPDIQVASRMAELEEVLRAHAVVLTPHVLRGMPRDGRKPSETDILMAGVYNLGFIGMTSRDDAHAMLDWWSERLLKDCHVAPERGLFVDQRWVDFVPGLVADLAIFRDSAYNVAYWNLPERTLARDGRGGYLVDGRPLRFFHFSGYSPDRRALLSKHQDRVQLSDDEVLTELCDAYGDALEAAGYRDVRELPYEHDALPSGLRLTKGMRALYRAGVEAGECPESLFAAAGEAAFLAWLNEPAPEAPALSRHLHALWRSRPDLQRVYPGVEQGDVAGYLGWCVAHGRDEVPIADALLAGHELPQRERGRRTPPERTSRPYGVNVAGYLNSELGIGEVARQLIRGLDAAAVPALPVGLVAQESRQGHAYAVGGLDDNPFAVNLVCVNADGTPGFAQQAGPRFFEERYTIGVWWWETSDFPERFMGAFEHVDEVWVGSRFVADTLAAVSPPVPVTHVPIPVSFHEPPPLRPGEHGWPDAFTFLYSWDYCSVFARKNPLAAIEAYRAAFGPDDGTALVLKCINPGFDPAGHRRVLEAAQGRADVVLVDDYLDPVEKDRMMRSCDCYVSPHRSEGLGLTVAEAMFHRRPVIATAYSGTADFMTPENSYAIPHAMVPIGRGADPYPPNGTWAEPDVGELARLMRRVFEQPEEAARRAERAAHDMRVRFSAEAAGKAMRARLDHVAARMQAPDAFAAAAAGRGELRDLLRHGARPTTRSRFGKPGGAVRRLVLRAIRPYTAYQQRLNAAVEQALVNGTAGAQASALAQLRAQRAQLDELSAALSAELARQRAQLEPASELVAASRALPYMASDVFHVFDAGTAGRVLGYDAPARTGADDDYRAFEELFRGSEAFIAERQRRYLDVIGRDCAPVLDVGCGRGELLDVLAAAGIAATGVDSDAGMVARCREKGHDVALADGIEHLAELEDGSLGLVFSAQVVEHLPPDVLKRFLALAARKLRPGGLLVAETVNPHSVAALKAFWVDVTHQHPLFPETLLALCRIAGFGSAYVFHPNGAGDVERDRYETGEYAVLARR